MWRAVQALPTPRHGMQAVTAGDTIFVIGGGPVAGYSVTGVNEGFTFAEPTTVDNAPAQEIAGFELWQNYPNPFNAGTHIGFILSVAAAVELSVYDVHGQEVALLLQQRLPAGKHEVVFLQERLVSGLYYYTLRAGGFVRTHKMLLLR